LPGNSPGSLTLLGDLSFSGVLGIDLDSAGLWDRLLVTGMLTFGSGYRVEFDLGFGLTEDAYRFDVVRADEGILGFDPSAFSIFGSYSGYNAELQNTCVASSRRCEIDLLLTRIHTDVPEPGTLLLAALGLGMLGSSRRRARKQDIESVAFTRPSTKADPANHPSRAGLARALLPR